MGAGMEGIGHGVTDGTVLVAGKTNIQSRLKFSGQSTRTISSQQTASKALPVVCFKTSGLPSVGERRTAVSPKLSKPHKFRTLTSIHTTNFIVALYGYVPSNTA